MPRHMAGATAGRAASWRGGRTAEPSRVMREQRGGSGRGGERDGNALDERPQERGIERAHSRRRRWLAEQAPAAALAPPQAGRHPPRARRPLRRLRGRLPAQRAHGQHLCARLLCVQQCTPRVRIPATAAKESCQPGSVHARGFQASVATAASRSAYQREAGRDAAIATTPARPITPARWSDAPLRPAARTQRSGPPHDESAAQAQPGQPQHGQRQRGEQTTFCPLTAQR